MRNGERILKKRLLTAILVWTLICLGEFFVWGTTVLRGNWLVETFGSFTAHVARTILGWLYGVVSILILFWQFTRK